MSKNCSDGNESPLPQAGGVWGGHDRKVVWANRPTPLRLRRFAPSLTAPPACGRGIALALLLTLAACAPQQSAAEKRAADDRAIAQVNAAQAVKPPPKPIDPQPILFADIQKYDLFGAGCAFAPGTSMGAVLLTRTKTATMLIDGHPLRFASDPGSTKLPLESFSRYVGKEMALSLTRSETAGEQASAELIRWPGHLVVTDPYDQVVYEAEGTVECRA